MPELESLLNEFNPTCAKASKGNKKSMILSLLKMYEVTLWNCTVPQITDILRYKGVHVRSNTRKAELVEMAVERGF